MHRWELATSFFEKREYKLQKCTSPRKKIHGQDLTWDNKLIVWKHFLILNMIKSMSLHMNRSVLHILWRWPTWSLNYGNISLLRPRCDCDTQKSGCWQIQIFLILSTSCVWKVLLTWYYKYMYNIACFWLVDFYLL